MNSELSGEVTMDQLLDSYPGARRALFSAFHIGGCQSCAYELSDTLAEVCEKHSISLEKALTCLTESQKHDQGMLVSPEDFQQTRSQNDDVLVLDTRTREEFEAAPLPGARLMTQELQTEVFASKDLHRKIILVDHQGKSVLDHCAWFRGHGLKNTYGLDGGLDRYAKEIDKSLPRYRLEMEESAKVF